MLSAQINRLITETGPATPCGRVLRQYWQPAALGEELVEPRPVAAVGLLGERLVAYRDDDGVAHLIGRHCPHRGADLAFGRCEDGGLRCPFHGWLFDGDGRCLEMPAEPDDSTMASQLRHTAYPCREKNGIVFAWLGEGEPPPLPALDCLAAPDDHTFAFKGLIECNWLQALEVGIDPAHASFLHRFLEDESPDQGYGLQFRDRAANSDIPITQVLRQFPRPDIDVDKTGYGLRIKAVRHIGDGLAHVRITNQVFPQAIVIPMSKTMTITQWHVPVDDETCYWYAIFTDFAEPVDKATMRAQRLELYTLPDYRPRLGRANNWGYDPQEQKTTTYTGMGLDINVHDQWAVESPGAIQDRTCEHLASSDKAIIAYRRLLRSAIAASDKGEDLPIRADGDGEAAIAVDTLSEDARIDETWREVDERRRAASPWAKRP